MMKYEQEDHFKFHSVKVPSQTHGKLIVYFKRLPQGEHLNEEDSLYTNLKNFVNFPKPDTTDKKTSAQMDRGEIPKSRTLVIMNFNKPFEIKPVMKLFKICGIIRRVYIGQLKMTDNNNKKKQVYIGLVIFKNEHDLTKCFETEYFQHRIHEKFAVQPGSIGQEKYQDYILKNFEKGDEEKDLIVQEARDEGFQIVTAKSGEFTVDFEDPKFRKQKWKGRNKKKEKQEIDMDELDEVIEGMDDKLPRKAKQEKDNLQKQQLLQEFEQDKLKLKRVKQNV